MLRESNTVGDVLRVIAVLFSTFLLSACGGDAVTATPQPPPALVAPSNLSYPSPQTFIAGQAVTAINPTVTGTVVSFSVSPALPAGLALNSGTGQITGTPNAAAASASYIVTASNSAGSTTFSLSVTVNPAAPTALSYVSPQTLVVGSALAAPLRPTVTGTASSYSVQPALPAGLQFNTSNGEISGTPTVATTLATYTITARNVTGTATFALQLAVNPAAPLALTYVSPQTLVVGNALAAPLRPTVTGTVSSYSVQPALPAGLQFNTVNGEISGTPTVATALATYTITARNVTGTATFALQLAVNPAVNNPPPAGGQRRDVFAYANSLHDHDAGAGNANTSTGNWIARMALAAPNGGNIYTLGRQFGFANSWTTPPNAGAQEEVTSLMSGTSWTNGSQIEIVEMVPDNFESVTTDPSSINRFGFAYTTRLLQIIDAWESNAPNPNRVYAIYAGWPDMAPYGDPATLTATQRNNYIAYALGPYQAWMELLVAQLRAARPALNIQLHDVNRATILAWRDTVVSTIPTGALFEDDAPHGRSTAYFLAAVADYIEIYDERPPAGFVFNPAWNVNSVVISNYQAIVDSIYRTLRP